MIIVPDGASRKMIQLLLVPLGAAVLVSICVQGLRAQPLPASPQPEIVFDLEAMEHVAPFAFLPGGEIAVGSSSSGDAGDAPGVRCEVRIWDVVTGAFRRGLMQRAPVESRITALSPDGKTFATFMLMQEVIEVRDMQTGKLLQSLNQAGNPAVFSFDGKILASVILKPNPSTLSLIGEIKLWDTGNGTLKHTLSAFPPTKVAPVTMLLQREPDYAKVTGDHNLTVAFSPDAKSIASAGPDGTVRLWDVEKGTLRQTLASQGMTAVAFSPDGGTLAGAGGRTAGNRVLGELKLWDVKTGQLKQTLQVPAGATQSGLLCLAFSPDGKTVAGGSMDGLVRLWGAQSATVLQTLGRSRSEPRSPEEENPIVDVGFAPDGNTLLSVAARTQGVGDFGGSKILSDVRLWDLRSGQIKHTLGSSERAALPWHSLASFSADGKAMVTEGNQPRALQKSFEQLELGRAHFWDAQTGELKRTLTVIGSINERDPPPLALSSDLKLMVSFDVMDGLVLWDVETGRQKRTIVTELIGPNSAVFSIDNRLMAANDSFGTVKLWEVNEGKLLRTLKRSSKTGVAWGHLPIAISPDGKLVASAASLDKGEALSVTGIDVWDATSGKLLWSTKWNDQGARRKALIFTLDSKALITAAESTELRDAQTGKLIHSFSKPNPAGSKQRLPGEAENDSQSPPALSRNGKLLANAVLSFAPQQQSAGPIGPTLRSMVNLWDVATGKLLRTVTISKPPTSMSFSPDGKVLLSTCDGTTILSEVGTGSLLATFVVLPGNNWVVFTPQGHYHCSTGAKQWMRWQIGSKVMPLETHEQAMHRTDLVQKALRGEN